MKKLFVIVLCSTFLFMEGCKDDEEATCTKEVPDDDLALVNKTRITTDSLAIVEYLAANSITDTQIKNNVRYLITQLGTGALPCIESTITAKYQGRLMKTGSIFDPSPGSGIDWEKRETSFRLSTLILGWQIALPVLPVGSKATLYIPSGYGYGVNGGAGGAIPSNANLIFEIEIVAFR
jgi:FKBP-type peptidyl-prolyl cis-trans isomerase FkpA